MSDKTVFFTGAGGFIGKYILRHYLDEPETELYLLEHGSFAERLRVHIDAQVPEEEERARIHILDGDITEPGLGLDESTCDELKSRITRAIHLAALYDLSVPKEPAHRVNVDGTRNVLDFLGQCPKLERLAYMSTIAISGWFEGTFTENDFDVGQRFKNHYDETKFLAEKLVRERRDSIPAVILRPTVVVGHSKTGAMEKIDGPYQPLVMISRRLHAVVQNSRGTKNHMVPVDYVADAFYALTEDPASTGGVFCLGDPNPLTYNAFFDLVCERLGAFKPLLRLPPAMVRPMFFIPGFSAMTGVTYEAYPYSIVPVEYDTSKAAAALEKHGIICPPAHDYIDVMLAYFKEHHKDRHVRRRIWRETI